LTDAQQKIKLFLDRDVCVTVPVKGSVKSGNMVEPMDTSFGGDEIQLSITKNYAGHWKTWEGVREMVQNWHDGLFSCSTSIVKEELKFNKVLSNLRACLSLFTSFVTKATPIVMKGENHVYNF